MKRGHLVIIAVAFLAVASAGYFLFNEEIFEETLFSPSAASQARAQIKNQAPIVQIQSITPDPLVFLPRTNEPVTVVFVAQDPNGVNNLNDSSARVEFDFTGTLPTEPIKRSEPCFSSTLGRDRFYTCTVTLEYYTAPGNWVVKAEVSDLGQQPATGEDNENYVVPLSKHITITPSEINFDPLVPGEGNFVSTTPTNVRNDGNYEGEIKVTATALTGEDNPDELIPAENFNAAGTSTSDVCAEGEQLNDGSPVSIQTSFLPRGPPGSDVESMNYCLTLVPIDLSSQFYSTQATGVPWTIGI